MPRWNVYVGTSPEATRLQNRYPIEIEQDARVDTPLQTATPVAGTGQKPDATWTFGLNGFGGG
jgi:hypothetical protein